VQQQLLKTLWRGCARRWKNRKRPLPHPSHQLRSTGWLAESSFGVICHLNCNSPKARVRVVAALCQVVCRCQRYCQATQRLGWRCGLTDLLQRESWRGSMSFQKCHLHIPFLYLEISFYHKNKFLSPVVSKSKSWLLRTVSSLW